MFNIKQSVLGSLQNRSKTELTAGVQSSVNSVLPSFQTGILEDFLDQGKQNYNDLYREIYLYDTVSGPTVDLQCNLPWSNYNVIGVDDPKIRQIIEDSLTEIGIQSLMPQISASYLVLGNVIGSLIFDENKGIFTDVIIQNPDDCDIQDIPLRGYDPKIDLKVNPEFKKFLRSKDKRDKEALKEIPPALLNKLLKSNKVELEPLNTLYMAKSIIPGMRSMSYFTRVVPIWLIEKALMRGTIIGAWRRQRSILHLTVGNDDWIATNEQLKAVSSMFINADLDPQGAVVATRPGVEANELKSGSDFWKVSDEWDVFSGAKMRALGVSDAFLSGDSNYNSMEVSLSVFMDNLRAFRDMQTNAVIYDKIFLMLAKYHGFKKRTQAELNHRIRIESSKNLADGSQYIIPKIKWHKDLQSKYDSNYVEMLKGAEEQGIKVPLLMFASAVGLSKSDILDSVDDDIQFRKDLKAYKDKIKELEGTENETENEDNDAESFSSIGFKPKSKRFLRDFKNKPKETILSAQQADDISRAHGV